MVCAVVISVDTVESVDVTHDYLLFFNACRFCLAFLGLSLRMTARIFFLNPAKNRSLHFSADTSLRRARSGREKDQRRGDNHSASRR
jgi:hypothetical protein